ncbi:hypothetical protein ALC57_08979 [Trachymyrmex cornetzi]|uniref:Uncharacterized protein n=1 Tax=Trachymyrmex cornetzi TaxID=471704 RepID=A0A151J653_9HYME|nr:hypothetical protein ALC57_08979 [Trachymyrmex cornetzi]
MHSRSGPRGLRGIDCRSIGTQNEYLAHSTSEGLPVVPQAKRARAFSRAWLGMRPLPRSASRRSHGGTSSFLSTAVAPPRRGTATAVWPMSHDGITGYLAVPYRALHIDGPQGSQTAEFLRDRRWPARIDERRTRKRGRPTPQCGFRRVCILIDYCIL